MAFKVKIDNVEYDLKDNFTIKDELNETLDSAIIQFNTYGQEANFESFDIAQIYDSENKITTKHMLVDSFDDEIHSFGSNFETDDHLYTVSLFSETKELERITLPNCSVTQPRTGTKKSVYDEIYRFWSLYAPIIKTYDSSETYRYSYEKKLKLDPHIFRRFDNITCPEFQWNNPTLREVLNDLFSTDDCIVVVKEGYISFYDLKQKGNPIDVSKLSFSKRTMSSQDYVGELTIDMQNAIGKEPSLVCEGITLRAPEGEGSLTTSNGVLKTSSPIYAIKRLRVKVPSHDGTATQSHPDGYDYYAWIDITDRVLEKEEFDLLSNVKIQDLNSSAYQALPDFTDQNGVTEKKHKVNFLYFKRGSNEICNVGSPYPYKPVGGVQHDTSFEQYALGEIHYQLYGTGRPGQNTLGVRGNPDPRNLQFYIEYETLAEHALRVGKNLPVKHPDNRIFDNQSNSYVDQEHMSIFEYAKVNRLGHKIRVIAGDYYNESEIPQLGDYIGDEILFSREITYEDNMLKFKGMLCPNYVLRDFFTGVRAKKRSWQIAKNEDALTRHDIYKLYIETSFNQKHDTFDYEDADGIINLQDTPILSYIIPIKRSNAAPYKVLGCAMQTEDKNNNQYPSTNNFILLDTQNAVLGRSFCIDFGFNDNYKSADYIITDGTETTQSFYAYADGNGEYQQGKIVLVEEPLKEGTDSHRTTSSYDSLVASIRKGYEMPKISSSDIQRADWHSTILVKTEKDNREIIRHTIQFEFCSDTEDIIVTDKFLKKIKYVDRRSHTSSDFFVYASVHKYNKDDTEVKGFLLPNTNIVLTTSGQNVQISIKDIFDDDYELPSILEQSWAIVDNEGDLLLAVNLQPNSARKMMCWFNLLRSRDDKVYTDYYNGVPIGDITDSGIANLDDNYNEWAQNLLDSLGLGNVLVQRRTINRDEDDENE